MLFFCSGCSNAKDPNNLNKGTVGFEQKSIEIDELNDAINSFYIKDKKIFVETYTQNNVNELEKDKLNICDELIDYNKYTDLSMHLYSIDLNNNVTEIPVININKEENEWIQCFIPSNDNKIYYLVSQYNEEINSKFIVCI